MEHAPPWVSVRSCLAPWPLLWPQLGAGESEAISLAAELKADALLVDDRGARREAAQQNVPVQGTLSVLDAAAGQNLLDFPEAIARLQKTNFRASPKLIQFFLDRHEAREKQRQI
jgi:predicted nucleic acid-binding protein